MPRDKNKPPMRPATTDRYDNGGKPQMVCTACHKLDKFCACPPKAKAN